MKLILFTLIAGIFTKDFTPVLFALMIVWLEHALKEEES